MALDHPISQKINEHKKLTLRQANRLLIAVLSFIGLALDGFQWADVFFGSSVILWIWLPEWDALEERLLNRIEETTPKHESDKRTGAMS